MYRSNALQTHIQQILLPTYCAGLNVFNAAIIALLLPLGITSLTTTTSGNAGGFFTYLRLPPDSPSAKIVTGYALTHKQLRMAFGHIAGDAGSLGRAEEEGGFGACSRLCWAWHEEGEIGEGVER